MPPEYASRPEKHKRRHTQRANRGYSRLHAATTEAAAEAGASRLRLAVGQLQHGAQAAVVGVVQAQFAMVAQRNIARNR